MVGNLSPGAMEIAIPILNRPMNPKIFSPQGRGVRLPRKLSWRGILADGEGGRIRCIVEAWAAAWAA